MIRYLYLAFPIMCVLWLLFCFCFEWTPIYGETPPTSNPLDRYVQPLSVPLSLSKKHDS